MAQDQDVLKCKVRVDTAPDAFEYKDVEVVGFKAKIRQCKIFVFVLPVNPLQIIADQSKLIDSTESILRTENLETHMIHWLCCVHISGNAVIAHVITCTYQVVDSKVVTTMLGGLQGAELSAFCEAHGWRVAADGKIFVAHQEEIVKSKNIVESMRFESTLSTTVQLFMSVAAGPVRIGRFRGKPNKSGTQCGGR